MGNFTEQLESNDLMFENLDIMINYELAYNKALECQLDSYIIQEIKEKFYNKIIKIKDLDIKSSRIIFKDISFPISFFNKKEDIKLQMLKKEVDNKKQIIKDIENQISLLYISY